MLCGAPLLDMVRYHLVGAGQTWIAEYGSADDPQQFAPDLGLGSRRTGEIQGLPRPSGEIGPNVVPRRRFRRETRCGAQAALL